SLIRRRSMKRLHKTLLAGALLTLSAVTGCGNNGMPAAPSEMTATLLLGMPHLTWKDNSDNETQFMIEHKIGNGEYKLVASVPFNTTSYHDASAMTGVTHTYHVMAMNDAGMSDPSNEATIAVP